MAEEDKVVPEVEVEAADYGAAAADDVTDALSRHNWRRLRELSLRPGGFGEQRRDVWPLLLHAQERTNPVKLEHELDGAQSKLRRRRRGSSARRAEQLGADYAGRCEPSAPLSSGEEQHPDEHQIKLDTDRSFVLYPVEVQDDREELQAELNGLITSVFRGHSRLSYFQGYHDIITVLFLTLPRDRQLPCAEKMSLHRLRDAMGKGLEPLIGLLQTLKYLLRLADPDYAALLERNIPLPYFALSNLLTLFSHDTPTLPLIQHIFDFLLSRPPIAAVYLAAAVVLARKDEAVQMEKEGEEGMLHSLLSSLPELSDGDSICDEEIETGTTDGGGNDNVLDGSLTVDRVKTEENHSIETGTMYGSVEDSNHHGGGDRRGEASSSDLSGLQPSNTALDGEIFQEAQNETKAEASLPTEEPLSMALGSTESPGRSSPGSEASSVPAPPSRSPSSLSNTSPSHPPHSKIPLASLLEHADTLMELYPPEHPSLHLSSIVGPQSVIFTWSEDPHNMATDAEAELMVTHPELVILPFVDPDDLPETKETGGKGPDATAGRRRRKLRRKWHPRHLGVRLDKKTVLTGAVVALGVAAAIYSMRTKGGHGSVLDVVRAEKGWRKTGKWISGLLIGGNERLLDTFGW
ncbi:hypothetical protein M0805_001489 [Coniferiporia weirii]|nr:hypothetical protein M0805_001489 [Coniferiporia weirii]